MALEKLDRASPDLWPDHSECLSSFVVHFHNLHLLILFFLQVPGVSQFTPIETPQDSPANLNVLQGLTQEDLGTIHREYFIHISLVLPNKGWSKASKATILIQ